LKFREFRTGIRQGPAKGHPTSLFRAPRNRLTPTLLRCRLELTAVSAICLLGLAIWFSKTEPLVAAATFCYSRLLSCIPFNFGGGILYFEALFLSSGRCRFVSALRLVRREHRAGALYFLLLRGGAEPTAFPPSLSTDFVDPFFPPIRLRRQCDFRRFEGRRFYHRRVGCQLRSLTSYFVFQFVRELPPPLRLRFPVRGARLLPPPRSESTDFFDPFFPLVRLRRLRDFAVSRGAASTTAAFGVNIVLSTPYSVFQLRPGGPAASAASPSCPRAAMDPTARSFQPSVRGPAAPLRQPVERREPIPNALLAARQMLNRDG
jgi:hypothetical protein